MIKMIKKGATTLLLQLDLHIIDIKENMVQTSKKTTQPSENMSPPNIYNPFSLLLLNEAERLKTRVRFQCWEI